MILDGEISERPSLTFILLVHSASRETLKRYPHVPLYKRWKTQKVNIFF